MEDEMKMEKGEKKKRKRDKITTKQTKRSTLALPK
jgi:hypothetical protein